jgi:hypothetical protein
MLIFAAVLGLGTAACSLASTAAGRVLATLPPAAPTVPAAASQPASPTSNTYHDADAGFSIQLPPTWIQDQSGDYPPRITKTVPDDTTLVEEWMEITVSDADPACMQPAKGGEVGQLTTAGGIQFFTENTVDLGAGNAYDSTRYSTSSPAKCISIVHVMHSTNPEMYDTPPASFDREAEVAAFHKVLDTFRFDP